MTSIRGPFAILRPAAGALCLGLLLRAASVSGARAVLGASDRHHHEHLSDEALQEAVAEFALPYRDQDYITARQDAIAFRASGLGRVLARVRRLQGATPKNSSLYPATAFVLAYSGVEYRANVKRIVTPVTLWDRQDPRWKSRQYEDFENAPDWLARLYGRHRDRTLLKTLFTWRLDGAPAEGLSVTRYHLILAYPLSVLRVLLSSPKMAAAALDTLSIEGNYSQVRRRLQRAARRADPRLRRFTYQFLRRLHAEMQKRDR